jgi:ABC-type lipoprotein release transport system permease subunit
MTGRSEAVRRKRTLPCRGPQTREVVSTGIPFRINLEALVLGFAVPAAIGVAFGFFPALRASRLDPIVALRYE